MCPEHSGDLARLKEQPGDLLWPAKIFLSSVNPQQIYLLFARCAPWEERGLTEALCTGQKCGGGFGGGLLRARCMISFYGVPHV